MNKQKGDGSAGDANYGAIGTGYSTYRQPDPRIGATIYRALGEARTVVNVGAGAGSYESATLQVTPVEPSQSMRLSGHRTSCRPSMPQPRTCPSPTMPSTLR